MTRRLLILTLLVSAGCNGPAEPDADVLDDRGGGHARPRRMQPATVKPFALDRVDVVLLVTGGTHGRLEVCNCPGPMAGGLSRRSGLAMSYRAAHANVVLLDLGDAFDMRPADLRNRYIFRAYRAAGYDAAVLGSHEWSALSTVLPGALERDPMCYLATNATPVKQTLPVVREVVHRFGGKKLALISHLGKDSLHFAPVAVGRELEVAGVDVVARRAAALKAKGCVVVLLAHVTEQEARALGGLKDVDLIVRGHTTRAEPKPMTVGATPMLKVGGREVVAAAALQIESGRIVGMDYRVEVVNDHWPIDSRVMGIYQAYAHQAMRDAMGAKRKQRLKYVPSATCGRCHVKQHEAWRRGPHRQAWQELAKAKRTIDPNCAMCHSSGFGTEHGFRTLKETPELAGVNCQDCHRINMRKGRCELPIPKLSKDTCELCHTPVNSPEFDFTVYRRRVGCVRAR